MSTPHRWEAISSKLLSVDDINGPVRHSVVHTLISICACSQYYYALLSVVIYLVLYRPYEVIFCIKDITQFTIEQ